MATERFILATTEIYDTRVNKDHCNFWNFARNGLQDRDLVHEHRRTVTKWSEKAVKFFLKLNEKICDVKYEKLCCGIK